MDYVRRREVQARMDDLLRTADQLRMERTLRDARANERTLHEPTATRPERTPHPTPTRRAGCPEDRAHPSPA